MAFGKHYQTGHGEKSGLDAELVVIQRREREAAHAMCFAAQRALSAVMPDDDLARNALVDLQSAVDAYIGVRTASP